MILLILSLFFVSAFPVERVWFLNSMSHGSSKSVISPIVYKKGTIEYKVLQLALDIESVLPTKLYDTDYQKKFMEMIPVPKSMHSNFLNRQKIYSDIKTLEKHRYIKEQLGFLVPHGAVTSQSRKLIDKENSYRKNLYSLIASHFKITDDKIIQKIPSIYGSAISNLKYYIMLTREPSITDSNKALASMTTSYKLNNVVQKLEKFLEKNNYKEENKTVGLNIAKFNLRFDNCKDSKPIFFKLNICRVFKSKPLCKEKIANSLLEGLLVNNGTLMWVEKESSKKTIFINNDKTEDKDVMLCKNRSFSFFDDLSQYLIKEQSKK